jgi:hypothetical protein
MLKSIYLLSLLLLLINCELHVYGQAKEHDYSNVVLELYDPAGIVKKPIDALEVGSSLAVGVRGISPGAPVNIYLLDDFGREWSYARLFANKRGSVDPTLFWFHTGVIGTTSKKIDFRPDPSFLTFDEAEHFFARHSLKLIVRDDFGRIVGGRELYIRKRQTATVYPSNEKGILVNAFDQANEDVYATGRNFPAGSTVHLFAVPNKFVWNKGDALVDQSGKEGIAQIETIKLQPYQTDFTVKIWDHNLGVPGSYDIVARIGDIGRATLIETDILSYAEDTGFLYYIIINGNIVIDISGRMRSSPAKFEFSDSFEKNENVYGAVDPTDVPAVHSGGNYAAYYVVEHQPASYWDGSSPALVDVSGGVEIQRIKYWCINASRTLIWPNATHSSPIKGYDVVVDFGSVPAMTSADFVTDNTYSKGTDFIDGYGNVGFWVFEDPSSIGPYPVGQVELNQPNGISGITDPTGTTGPTQNVTLAWARIMYPATMAGTGTPVSGTLSNYPVALFLHGRHWNCDNDGSGPGLAGNYSFSCSAANRIPNHEGYNYIMERLASQGIFCISISAHDIQPGLGIWDYDARGRLILKFLDKLRSWNNSGTDPFGGIFSGKLDMTKIALSGHSRGGEGVVAAQTLNATWPSPHSIVAVNAIAPTDQNATSYVMNSAPYYLLMGARDGDVATMQGYRTYDRSFPVGAPTMYPKVVANVYGANHNYFNTIWTDAAALGSPNPWAGATDDGGSLTVSQVLTAAQQRQIARTTICAFFRQHLQGIDAYKEILTGRLEPSAMQNQHVFWTYQDGERKAVDNFEQTPLNANQNSLGGSVSGIGFTTFAEMLLNNGSSDYPIGFSTDSQFFHDTLGMRLAWASPQTYTTSIPVAHRNVSAYSHLTFRVAKRVTGSPVVGSPINLLVNIQDGAGHTAMAALRTDQFDPIPHPYRRSGGWCGSCSNQSLMTGVRIPLRNFTMNNSGVDLTDIVNVTIRTEGSGEIGIDDIEFGK